MNHRFSQLAMGADKKLVRFAVLLLDVANDRLLIRAGIQPQIEGVDQFIAPVLLIQSPIDQHAANVGRVIHVNGEDSERQFGRTGS